MFVDDYGLVVEEALYLEEDALVDGRATELILAVEAADHDALPTFGETLRLEIEQLLLRVHLELLHPLDAVHPPDDVELEPGLELGVAVQEPFVRHHVLVEHHVPECRHPAP